MGGTDVGAVRSRRLAAIALALVGAVGVAGCTATQEQPPPAFSRPEVESQLPTVTVELPVPQRPDPLADGIKVASFLGDETRRYYGEGPVPEKLEVIWRASIGSGTTGGTARSKGEPVVWAGTGWTGQPALVREGGKLYLLVGGFDHNLVKIDAETGTELWAYRFDDVIKGSPTVFRMPDTGRLAVVCGSRRGFPRAIGDPSIAPVRCVDFETGQELWRMTAPTSKSYSRDADSSPILIGDTLFVAIETGHVYAVDPTTTEQRGGYRWPVVKAQQLLLGSNPAGHGGNLVLESSPSVIGDTLYLASGAGDVYGLSLADLSVTWNYWIGSDLDGSPVTTEDGFILQAVEKQYIPGNGGVLKLDPRKPPAEAVSWFFPTGNRAFGDWQGGIIGSVSVNDEYGSAQSRPALASFIGIDGNLYVVSQDETDGTTLTPQGTQTAPVPTLVFKDNVGGAISTPIMVDNYVIAAGYDALVHVYRIDYEAPGGVPLKDRSGREWLVGVTEVATFSGGGSFESTPIVWQGRIYIGSRNGFFYCLGDPAFGTPSPPEAP